MRRATCQPGHLVQARIALCSDIVLGNLNSGGARRHVIDESRGLERQVQPSCGMPPMTSNSDLPGRDVEGNRVAHAATLRSSARATNASPGPVGRYRCF